MAKDLACDYQHRGLILSGWTELTFWNLNLQEDLV